MDTSQVFAAIRERFGGAIVEENTTNRDPFVKVAPASLHDVMAFLRDDPRFRCDLLSLVSGVDYGDDLGVVYHAESTSLGHVVVVKADLPRAKAEVATVSDLWSAANWHEREAFDLVGITFTGHPNLVRILTAEDWVGHPLRKDYQFPTEYHGIVCEFEGIHDGTWAEHTGEQLG